MFSLFHVLYCHLEVSRLVGLKDLQNGLRCVPGKVPADATGSICPRSQNPSYSTSEKNSSIIKGAFFFFTKFSSFS